MGGTYCEVGRVFPLSRQQKLCPVDRSIAQAWR